MDSDKYLRKRGWEESRDGTWRNAGVAEFRWLHPEEAFKYQLQCDAEALDRLRDENRALKEGLAATETTLWSVCDATYKAMDGIVTGVAPQDLLDQIQKVNVMAGDAAKQAQAALKEADHAE